MWKWLVRTAEPTDRLRDPVERHKARLMAGILLLVVPVGILAVLAGDAAESNTGPSWVMPFEVGTLLVMGMLFPWAKGEKFRRAAFGFIFLGTAIVGVVVVSVPDRGAFNTTYMVIPLTIAQIFFGSRMSLLFFGLNLSTVSLLGFFVPGLEGLLSAPVLSFHILVGGCLVLGGAYRTRMTREKQADLESREAKHRALLEVGFDGIADLQGGLLVSATEGFADVFGLSVEQMLGKPVSDFFPSDEAQTLTAVQSELTERLVEVRALRADGREFPVELVAQSQDYQRGVDRVIALRDITDRREVFARMQITDRMAAMGTLAAGVAHEINNPLTFVSGNVERALAALEAEEALSKECMLQWLSSAAEGTKRVERIVGDLNTFARDPGEEGLEPLEIEKVLNSSVSIAFSAIKHRARLVREHEPNVVVLADQTRLSQVLVNLLLNAAQAMPDDATERNEIALRSYDEDGEVLIEVADNGPGIPAHILPRIFEPFFTTKPVGVGTGLGLSICKNLVERMGGVMEVETSPEGTLFRLRLHPAEGLVPSQETWTKPPVELGKKTAKILVIDDEEEIGNLLVDMLAPHQVDVCFDGRSALQRIGEESFDVILCDLMMPEMTGMEFYDLCVAKDLELAKRFVFLTGGAFTQPARDFLGRVEQPCLTKPFRPQQIREMIALMMRS